MKSEVLRKTLRLSQMKTNKRNVLLNSREQPFKSYDDTDSDDDGNIM